MGRPVWGKGTWRVARGWWAIVLGAIRALAHRTPSARALAIFVGGNASLTDGSLPAGPFARHPTGGAENHHGAGSPGKASWKPRPRVSVSRQADARLDAEPEGSGEAGFPLHGLLFRRDGRLVAAQGAQQAGVVGQCRLAMGVRMPGRALEL